MGEHDDRESWSQVPGSGGELWASDAGQIATLDPAGGFDILPQRTNQFAERFVRFKGGGRKTTGARMVASMVLAAFEQPRLGGHSIVYEDGDPGNCRLANLTWRRKGQPRVVDLKERRCLGPHCNVMFLSSGPGHRLCPACANRVKGMTLSGLEGTEASDLPDEPLVGGGFQDR